MAIESNKDASCPFVTAELVLEISVMSEPFHENDLTGAKGHIGALKVSWKIPSTR